MDNKTLDSILLALKAYGEPVMGDRFMDDNHQLMNGHRWETVRDFLRIKGYIDHNQMLKGPWWIRITPEGEKFINEGGFTAEDDYRTRTLNYARKSKDFAFWALVVSILGIMVAVVLFILDKK